MKIKLFSIFSIVAMLLTVFGPSAAFAGAYATSFTTSITYQNVGSAATTSLTLQFYASPSTTTPVTITRPNLAPGAGTSLFIGSLSEIGTSFQGGAVMQSDQPLLATLVQLPQGSTTVKNRPLSNGFSSGTPTSLIATVLKNTFDTNSIFSVQNVDTAQNNVTITFFNTSAQQIHTMSATISPGAAFYVDAGKTAELGGSFNGSAVITAKRGDNSDGKVVSSDMELGVVGTGASAFEGVGAGSTTFYMPSALCNAFGGANTSYAVQNTSLTAPTDVTVTYSPGGAKATKTIGPGAKQSFVACDAGMGANFNGSAVVTSSATPVIAIGKAYGIGLTTAFVGAASGAAKLALPYVRWATDANYNAGTQQRVNLTIQNIGTADIPAGTTVQYIDRDGLVVGTHTLGAIAAGAKLNSNPTNAGLTEFGVYNNGTQFGGGAIITAPAGSQLAAVARVQTKVGSTLVGEDYNGMPVP